MDGVSVALGGALDAMALRMYYPDMETRMNTMTADEVELPHITYGLPMDPLKEGETLEERIQRRQEKHKVRRKSRSPRPTGAGAGAGAPAQASGAPAHARTRHFRWLRGPRPSAHGRPA